MSLVPIVVAVRADAVVVVVVATHPALQIFATLARNYGIHYEGFSHMCLGPIKAFEHSSYVEMLSLQMGIGNYVKRFAKSSFKSPFKLGHTFQFSIGC